MQKELFESYSQNVLLVDDLLAVKNNFDMLLDVELGNFKYDTICITKDDIEKKINKQPNHPAPKMGLILELTGPNGNKAKILTAWIETDTKGKRLTTIYVLPKESGI